MKKAIIAIAALMAVLAVIYLAGSWYFSGLIVKFTPRTLEQQQASPANCRLRCASACT